MRLAVAGTARDPTALASDLQTLAIPFATAGEAIRRATHLLVTAPPTDAGDPVLLIAPYFEADASIHGMTEATKKAYYGALIEAAPKAQVVTVAPARHFAMIDQPEQVNEAIRAFLKTL